MSNITGITLMIIGCIFGLWGFLITGQLIIGFVYFKVRNWIYPSPTTFFGGEIGALECGPWYHWFCPILSLLGGIALFYFGYILYDN